MLGVPLLEGVATAGGLGQAGQLACCVGGATCRGDSSVCAVDVEGDGGVTLDLHIGVKRWIIFLLSVRFYFLRLYFVCHGFQDFVSSHTSVKFCIKSIIPTVKKNVLLIALQLQAAVNTDCTDDYRHNSQKQQNKPSAFGEMLFRFIGIVKYIDITANSNFSAF